MGGAKNCPETPRQKMIGMMYLVLTAMLALNVSTDILKAFKLVDDSLHSTLETTEKRNQAMMDDFKYLRDDNPQKNGPWYDMAVELTEKADSLFDYIQDFKYQIAVRTDGAKKADPEARVIQGSDNRDVTHHYALPDAGEKPGIVLKEMIIAYREYLISISDSAKAEEFKVLFDTSDKPEKDGKMITWEEQMFHDMPSGASVTLLTKMQNDVRNAQSEMIQYIKGQTDAGDYRVNKLEALVVPTSKNVIKGSKYTAQIILSAVDSTKVPTFFVNGNRIAENGIYEVNCNSEGAQKYSGEIRLPKGDGTDLVLPFASDYSVMAPSIALFNIDMMIMYRDYENKFKISVPGIAPDKIKVQATGANVTSRAGVWYFRVNDKAEQVKVTVQADIDGKLQMMGSEVYDVKPLPRPSAFFVTGSEKYSEGKVAKKDLTNTAAYLEASYGKDGVLKVPFTVSSFELYAGGRFMRSTSNKLTPEMTQYIKNMKSNEMLTFMTIKALTQEGKEVKMSSLSLQIK